MALAVHRPPGINAWLGARYNCEWPKYRANLGAIADAYGIAVEQHKTKSLADAERLERAVRMWTPERVN